MRHDSLKITTAFSKAIGKPGDLIGAINILDALDAEGYAIVAIAPPLADPAKNIIAGEVAAGGGRTANEVAARILDRLAQAGLAPGAGKPAGRHVPIRIAGVSIDAYLPDAVATELAAALAQGRAA